MKKIILILALTAGSVSLFAQQIQDSSRKKTSDTLLVEASCGECRFGMKGKGCQLAIRINGNSYFVDGTSIDKHGDAHGKNGFCNAIRQAKVTGEIKDDRFLASSFVLLPSTAANK